MVETPFRIIDATTCKFVRHATITECKWAVRQMAKREFTHAGRRLFFPMFAGHDFNDVQTWLDRNGHGNRALTTMPTA